jgi:hypothetical protein
MTGVKGRLEMVMNMILLHYDILTILFFVSASDVLRHRVVDG